MAGLALDLGCGYGGAFAVAGLIELGGAYSLLPLARRGGGATLAVAEPKPG